MKKVIVTGYFNETFEGTEKDILKYLGELKDRQFSLLSENDQKYYLDLTKNLKTCQFNNAHEHNAIKTKYLNDYDRLKIREKYKSLGLKIIIL